MDLLALQGAIKCTSWLASGNSILCNWGRKVYFASLKFKNFFLLWGLKINLLALQAAIKCTLWLASGNSILCNWGRKVYFASVKFDTRAKRGQQSHE